MGLLKGITGMFPSRQTAGGPPASGLGRNEPCWCGSGKKYKKCCLQTDDTARARELDACKCAGST